MLVEERQRLGSRIGLGDLREFSLVPERPRPLFPSFGEAVRERVPVARCFRKRAQSALAASLGPVGADQSYGPGSSVARLRHVWGGSDSRLKEL